MGVLHSSYTMGTCILPDTYTLSPWALGVYISQTIHAHGITIKRLTGLKIILPLCLLLSFLPPE